MRKNRCISLCPRVIPDNTIKVSVGSEKMVIMRHYTDSYLASGALPLHITYSIRKLQFSLPRLNMTACFAIVVADEKLRQETKSFILCPCAL